MPRSAHAKFAAKSAAGGIHRFDPMPVSHPANTPAAE